MLMSHRWANSDIHWRHRRCLRYFVSRPTPFLVLSASAVAVCRRSIGAFSVELITSYCLIHPLFIIQGRQLWDLAILIYASSHHLVLLSFQQLNFHILILLSSLCSYSHVSLVIFSCYHLLLFFYPPHFLIILGRYETITSQKIKKEVFNPITKIGVF